MVSTTITRWCDSALVCILSIASTALATALSKPKVTSVSMRSLSMVFGTPTKGIPFLHKRLAMERLPSPPIHTNASRSHLLMFPRATSDRSWGGTRASSPRQTKGLALLEVPRMVPPWARIPETSLYDNVRPRPSTSPAYPSSMPKTVQP